MCVHFLYIFRDQGPKNLLNYNFKIKFSFVGQFFKKKKLSIL